jgi:hypothetical protein
MELKTRYQSDLSKFAKEFSDEAHLRKVLADLFAKAGMKGVRITHGPNERGKDIIFYTSGGLSRDVVYACVVKNDRITGQAQSSAGSQTILNQAIQALAEPYVDRTTGREELVHSVYVISPYECTPDAIEHIRAQLRERARQVEFLCGIDLLALFQEHWPDFLRFESAVLTRYLTELRAGLSIDKPLIALLTRHNPGFGLRPFESFYVASNVEIRVDRFRVPDVSPPAAGLLRDFATQAEVESGISSLRYWKQALRCSELIDVDQTELDNLTRFTENLRKRHKSYWEKGLHTRQYRDSPLRPEERQLQVPEGDRKLYERCLEIIGKIRQHLVDIQRSSIALRAQFEEVRGNCEAILSNKHLAVFSSAFDYQSALPGLLRHTPGPVLAVQAQSIFREGRAVLISGPPGSGKTSYCRWHTLQAIEEFASDPAKPVPVYVSAHRLATATITTFEETILESTLSRIGDGKSSEESLSIRLFVDGLDEVPDRSQQQRIINMLRDGLNRHPKVSVIVTARPYVWGAWMNWMPRVHMAEFTADQQRLLASKWIADETQVNQLFSELDSSPALLKLMGTPLLATLILNLFSRTPVLPENKVSLYRTFVDLYCGGWDAAKGIAKIGRFKSEQKLRLLTALAYRMHVAHKAECTEDRCISVLKEIMPALQSQGMDILTEIVQDGILVRAGRDLVFAHLSFQEYLAAQFLASDPLGARPKQALLSYLRGEDWWKEVVEFYLISRDDPTALDGWIDRIAAGATRSNDIAHRLDRLAIVIHEAFAGFKTTFTNSRQ